jgi:hypothetical protein
MDEIELSGPGQHDLVDDDEVADDPELRVTELAAQIARRSSRPLELTRPAMPRPCDWL